MNLVEQGITRRHTFFCVDRERHTHSIAEVIEAVPKVITVFGKQVHGWVITTEEPVIDKTIPIGESLEADELLHDPE